MANDNGSGSGKLTKADLEEVLTQIFEIADEAGGTKEEMRAALDEISDLADPDTEIEQGTDGRWQVVESDDEGAEDGDDEGDEPEDDE
jgi:hypothetical protein